jgi:hypothetical protein
MMAAARLSRLACLVVGMVLSAASAAEEVDDLRDLRVGMAIDEIPSGEYINLACASAPDHMLAGWTEYRTCPTAAAGLHAVRFQFNDRLNALAQVNDKYEGTRVAGHPVLLTLLIDDRGVVDALRIDTDPQARLFWRKKAYLLAPMVKTRYGEESWDCHSSPPEGGETPVGGLFIKEHCEKSTARRKLLLDQSLYRRPGQSMSEFVNETHLEIQFRASSFAPQPK